MEYQSITQYKVQVLKLKNDMNLFNMVNWVRNVSFLSYFNIHMLKQDSRDKMEN